jgi:hypothetical protein
MLTRPVPWNLALRGLLGPIITVPSRCRGGATLASLGRCGIDPGSFKTYGHDPPYEQTIR